GSSGQIDRLFQTLLFVHRNPLPQTGVTTQQVTADAVQVIQIVQQRGSLPAVQLAVAQLLLQGALEVTGKQRRSGITVRQQTGHIDVGMGGPVAQLQQQQTALLTQAGIGLTQNRLGAVYMFAQVALQVSGCLDRRDQI